MTVYKKELRQALRSWGIWTGAIALMLVVCVALFPEMKGEMDSMSSVFANMGGFTAAFGMDRLNFGEFMGFYGIECGNVLGIGGGFFAALAGISVLAREEKERTAEFLFTHPVGRASVLAQKLLAVLTQVFAMNMAVTAVSLLAAEAVGEKPATREFLLLHAAYLLLMLEIACLCFGISAFIRRGGPGIGLGLALVLYCMNLLCNISDRMNFLRWITPYAYAEASDIIAGDGPNPALIGLGLLLAAAGTAAGWIKYTG
ncbi:MAG: ABC transporter permease, partial [Lachnospiraceae bacterium]|nr:ABC transporter permease [Lachnospiraceae bacterium]